MKRYNLFILLTTFARVLIEIFIPVILYKQGFNLKSILLFLIVAFIFNIITVLLINMTKPCYKLLAFSSAFLFILMYYLLSIRANIYLLSLLYSLNNTFYFLVKHNYGINVIDKKIGTRVGGFMIWAILAGIPASYIGSILIKKLSTLLVIVIVLVIYILGILPILKIKLAYVENKVLLKELKKVPLKNILFFIAIQFKTIFFLLFPLYIFIYIKKQLEYVGIINLITGIASIIFIFFYSRFMDKKKNDFMFYSALFLSVITLIEVTLASSFALLFTSFVEGMATKMYEVSTTRDIYYIDKKVDKNSYFILFELINNLSKLIIVVILYFLNNSFQRILIILVIGIFISGLVKYQTPKEKSTY